MLSLGVFASKSEMNYITIKFPDEEEITASETGSSEAVSTEITDTKAAEEAVTDNEPEDENNTASDKASDEVAEDKPVEDIKADFESFEQDFVTYEFDDGFAPESDTIAGLSDLESEFEDSSEEMYSAFKDFTLYQDNIEKIEEFVPEPDEDSEMIEESFEEILEELPEVKEEAAPEPAEELEEETALEPVEELEEEAALEPVEELEEEVFMKAREFYEQYCLDFKRTSPVPFVDLALCYLQFAREETNLFKLLFLSKRDEHNTMYDLINGKEQGFVIKELKRIPDLDMNNAGMIFMKIFIFMHGMACMTTSGEFDLEEGEIGDLLTEVIKKFSA